jgi:hypothetical protein
MQPLSISSPMLPLVQSTPSPPLVTTSTTVHGDTGSGSALPITAGEILQLVYAALDHEPYLRSNRERGAIWRKMTAQLHKQGCLLGYGWEGIRNKVESCIKHHEASFISHASVTHLLTCT